MTNPAGGPTPAPAKKKPIWTRWWMIAIYAIVAIGVIANLAGGGKGAPKADEAPSSAPVASSPAPKPASPKPTPSEPVKTEAAKPVETPKAEPEAPKETAPAVSAEFSAALSQAQTYVDTMPFSKAGLLAQLTSEYGGKFPKDAGQYAVDNVGADWNAQALKAAISYRDTMSMSAKAIHDQLTSEYGGQFTKAEADYAIANLPG